MKPTEQTRSKGLYKREAPLIPRLTVGSSNVILYENRQEVDNNVDIQPQTQAASDSEGNSFYGRADAARTEARGQSSYRSERETGVGRFLQTLRNYGTVRRAEGRSNTVRNIRNAAEVRSAREVSAQDLRITNGTAEATAKLLTDEKASRVRGWDGRNWNRAVAEYAKLGYKLQAMVGQVRRQVPGADNVEQVRAYYSPSTKTITVQVDHPTLTWNQLLDHEETHRLIKEDAAYKKAVQEALLADEKLKPYLADILRRYNEKYNEVDPNMTADEVAEEMLADYRAGFDMLDPLGTLAGVRKATKAAARDIRALERKGTKGEAAAESEENGDSIRYSINMDFSGVTPATLEESVMMDATDKRNLARYIGEVDRALNRTLPFTQKILIGRPSPILSQYMKSDNPLCMTQRAAKKSLLGKERRRENTGLVKQCFMNFRSTWRTRLLLQEIRPSILNVGKTVLLFGQIGYQKTEMA